MRSIILATAAALLLGTAGASAQQAWGFDAYGRPMVHAQRPQPFLLDDSRVSYGTGYHGRTSVTGGPVGGLPSRN